MGQLSYYKKREDQMKGLAALGHGDGTSHGSVLLSEGFVSRPKPGSREFSFTTQKTLNGKHQEETRGRRYDLRAISTDEAAAWATALQQTIQKLQWKDALYSTKGASHAQGAARSIAFKPTAHTVSAPEKPASTIENPTEVEFVDNPFMRMQSAVRPSGGSGPQEGFGLTEPRMVRAFAIVRALSCAHTFGK